VSFAAQSACKFDTFLHHFVCQSHFAYLKQYSLVSEGENVAGIRRDRVISSASWSVVKEENDAKFVSKVQLLHRRMVCLVDLMDFRKKLHWMLTK
jgi:hypothetical protein